MTSSSFLRLHKEFLDKMQAIIAAKNADYAGCDDNAFANFMMVEVLGVTSTEIGLVTRITDKFSRILTFMKGNFLKVKDEAIEDTILDMANYLLVLACYLRYKKTLGEMKFEHVNPGEDVALVSKPPLQTIAEARDPNDPWHCAPRTETVNWGIEPMTVHYGSPR